VKDCGDAAGTNTGYRRHMDARKRARAEGRRAKPTCRKCKDGRAAWQRGYENRRILARGERLMIPALGTQRRLRALAVMGWSFAEIGRRLGDFSGTNVSNLARVPEFIYADTEEKVKAIFEELCMVPGPDKVARTRALRKGWAGPLEWDDIDDPAEEPQGRKAKR
jgi:hypothetical protein